MCPGCVFAYHTDYSRNYGDTLTSSDYKTSYQDVIAESEKSVFLGMILNNDNQIVRAFACGINHNRPFCIEGGSTDKYSSNRNYLYRLYGGYDLVTEEGCDNINNGVRCDGLVIANADNSGFVMVDASSSDGASCWVNSSGSLGCTYYSNSGNSPL